MKERIVLEEHEFYNLLHFLPTQMVKIIKKERKALFIGKEIKPEKVPETFEELKELCKQTGYYDDVLYPEYIFVYGLGFRKNGDIDDIEGSIIAENRTPAQMWQIIKSLIGE